MLEKKPEMSLIDTFTYFTLNQLDDKNEFVNGIISDILREDDPLVIINRAPSLHIEAMIAMKINEVIPESVVRLPPNILQYLGADFDGDLVAVIPIFTKEAKKEALEYLSLDRLIINKYGGDNLSFEMLPYQDHKYGIYLLEQDYSKNKHI